MFLTFRSRQTRDGDATNAHNTEEATTSSTVSVMGRDRTGSLTSRDRASSLGPMDDNMRIAHCDSTRERSGTYDENFVKQIADETLQDCSDSSNAAPVTDMYGAVMTKEDMRETLMGCA